MIKGTLKRWTRGLLPSLALLFLVLLGTFYLAIATWGLPRFVCSYLEEKLQQEGIPVTIGNLRITIFSGLVVHADDIDLKLKLDGNEQTVGHIGNARIDIHLSELLSGNFDLKNIQISNADITLPAATESNPASRLEIAGLHASIALENNGSATIENAACTLQGMHVAISGKFPLDLKNESSGPSTSVDLDETVSGIIPSIGHILEYTDRITWPKDGAPSIEVRFNQERNRTAHVEIALKAPELRYQGATIHRLDTAVLYTNDALIVDRLIFHSLDPVGWFNMTGRMNFKTRELRTTLTSSVPLIRWYSRITGQSILPSTLELVGQPDLKAETHITFSPEYDNIETLSIYGDINLAEFSVGALQFDSIGCSFYYKDEALYVHDLALRARAGTLTGSAMAYDQQLHFYLDNKLPASTLLALANELGKAGIQLPPALEITGTTDFLLDAHMAFPKGWTEPMVLNESALRLKLQNIAYKGSVLENLEMNLQLAGDFTKGWDLPPSLQHCDIDLSMGGLRHEDIQLDDLHLQASVNDIDWASWDKLTLPKRSTVALRTQGCTYKGEQLGNLKVQASAEGENMRINECTLDRPDGRVNLVAHSEGNIAMVNLDSDFPLHVYQNIFAQGSTLPEGLVLPKKANIQARATLDIHELIRGLPVRTFLKYLYVGTNLSDFAWNKVALQHLTVDAVYEQAENDDARLTINNFLLKNNSGELQFVAKGSLLDKILIEGKSTIRLDTIDQLVEDPDLHDIAAYFKWNAKSTTAAQFTVVLNTLDPGTGYAVKGNAQITDVNFRGVDISEASTYVEVKKGAILLRTPSILYNNRDYLQTKKKRGAPTSRLIADSTIFDLQKNIVTVKNFRGTVFPDYSLRMFAPAAARALDRFQFQQAVTLSGSGTYPLGDDMGSMASRVIFNTNGLTVYPLLGTDLQLVNTTGQVDISPQWVKVSNLTGNIWNGAFNGQFQIQIDGGDALNGELQLSRLNLYSIAQSYKTTLSPATVNLILAFTSDGGKTSSIKGGGYAQILNGNFVEFSLFSMIGRLLGDAIPGLNHFVNYNIQQASFNYTIDKGYLTTNDFTCSGTNIALAGNGKINIDKLYVNAFLRLRLRGLMGVVTLPIYLLTQGIFEFRGEGPLEDVNWRMTPYSGKSQSIPDPPDESTVKKNKR